MKKFASAPLLALFAVLASAHAFAQGFVLTDTTGFSEKTVFSTDNGIGGFDFDTAGDIIYLGGTGGGASDQGQLLDAPAGNYQNSSSIINFASAISGDFVKVQGSTIYYGYYASDSSGPVNAVTTTGSAIQSYNYPGNYDMAFSGTTGFISANTSGSNNQVFDLSTGKSVLNTNGDYSGPVAFDASGDLIYGGSGVAGAASGIYIYSVAAVLNAETTGTAIKLGSPTINDPGNSAFAVAGNDLFVAFNNYMTSTTTLDLYNLANPSAPYITIGTDTGNYLAAIREFNGSLFIDDTDGESTSTIFQLTPVPEPGSAWLALAGLILLIIFHRRRTHGETR